MFAEELARVLTLPRTKRLEYLARLSPSDADAIALLIDDCLRHRWPKTAEDWFAVAERLPAKHSREV